MRSQAISRIATTLTLVTLLAMSVCPTAVRAGDTYRWSVKTGPVILDTDAPFSIENSSGGRIHAGGNVEIGAAVAIRYRVSKRFGVELATAFSKTPDVEDGSGGDGYELGEGPSFRPVILGANFHLVSTDRFEFSVGPRAAFASFGDFDLDVDGENRSFGVSNEFGWGAAVGLGYRIGHSRWSLVAEATFLDMDMEITEHGVGDVTAGSFDPFIANLGVAYRF